MMTVSKSKLKARMLELFRLVEHTGEEIVVTSHNRPVIRITRLGHVHTVHDAFAHLRGKVEIDDSIMEPETEEWGDV